MLQPQKYLTKPVEVEAMRFHDTIVSRAAIASWIPSAQIMIMRDGESGDWVVRDADGIHLVTAIDFEERYEHQEDAEFSESIRWDPGTGEDSWEVDWPGRFQLAADVGEGIEVWVPSQDGDRLTGEPMWLEVKDIFHCSYEPRTEYWVSSDGHDFETMRAIFDALKEGATP